MVGLAVGLLEGVDVGESDVKSPPRKPGVGPFVRTPVGSAVDENVGLPVGLLGSANVGVIVETWVPPDHTSVGVLVRVFVE